MEVHRLQCALASYFLSSADTEVNILEEVLFSLFSTCQNDNSLMQLVLHAVTLAKRFLTVVRNGV